MLSNLADDKLLCH